jgi:peptidoglycan/LPS O-acetylase OafA/YrhL
MAVPAGVSQAGEVRSARVESLRALAALAVVEGHVWATSVGTTDNLLHRALLGGGFGVFLFFALSGYLLYRPFARRDFADGGAISLRRYFINRALRILPLYYATTIILLLLFEHGGSRQQWLRFGLLAQTFSDATVATVNGPTWSLVVEVHYYLLLPLLGLVVAVLARGRLWLAATLLGVVGLASLVLRYLLVTSVPNHPLTWQYSTLTNFVFFIPGMWLALLQVRWRDDPPAWLRGPLRSSTLWLAAAVTLWLLVWWDYSLDVAVLAAAFLTVGACVLPLRPGRAVRALDWRPLAILGVASYSLYLWHDPIVGRLPQVTFLPRDYLVYLAVSIPVCCLVALVSYRLFEAPWLRLRSTWTQRSEEKRSLSETVPGARAELDAVEHQEPNQAAQPPQG